MLDHHVRAWRRHLLHRQISDVPRPTSKGPHLLFSIGGLLRWLKRPKGYGIGEVSFGRLLGLGAGSDAEATRRFMADEISAEEAAAGHARERSELKERVRRGMKHATRTASVRVTKAMLEEAYHEHATANGNEVFGHLVAVREYLSRRYGIIMHEETISAELHRHGIRRQRKVKGWP